MEEHKPHRAAPLPPQPDPRRDHLAPSPLPPPHSHSHYRASFSPPSLALTPVDKQLQLFRKHENSTSQLAGLPSILDGSHYQQTYQGHSQEKQPLGKERESWFLKMNWALDPTSNYQKEFLQKNGATFNKENRERPNHNHLALSHLQQGKRVSQYRSEFHPYTIKKEAQLSIGDKDHLNNKDTNSMETGLSQYQRRYDSVMELAKPKETVASVYRKENVVGRKNRLQI